MSFGHQIPFMSTFRLLCDIKTRNKVAREKACRNCKDMTYDSLHLHDTICVALIEL